MTRARLLRILKLDPIRARGMLFQIAAILYPTPDHVWSPETLDAIARVVDEATRRRHRRK